MAYDDYEVLRVHVEGGIARATIDNPPINLLDLALILLSLIHISQTPNPKPQTPNLPKFMLL